MRLCIGKETKWISGSLTSADVKEMKTAIKSGIEVNLNGRNIHLHKGQPARNGYTVRVETTGSIGPDATRQVTVPGIIYYDDSGNTQVDEIR